MSNTTPGLPPYAVPFGPHANCTLDICPAQYSVYGYQASLPANVAFLSVYIIVAMLHAQLGIMTKHWWFRLFMIAGAINAMLGYTARLFMYDNPFDYTAFQMQIGKSNHSNLRFQFVVEGTSRGRFRNLAA